MKNDMSTKIIYTANLRADFVSDSSFGRSGLVLIVSLIIPERCVRALQHLPKYKWPG